MRNLMYKIFPLLVVVLFSVQLGAQDLASLTGVVTDSSGAVIGGANVSLSNDAISVSYNAVTNGIGSYTFANVAPGPAYKISVAAPGFKTAVITGIYLNV